MGLPKEERMTMSKIKKVLITEFGDEDKLVIVEDEIPEPAAREVQIAVEYSIVSGSDVNMRRGTYPFQRKAPLTPGYSVVGKVRTSGQGSSRFQTGNRVACLSKYGGQAELINLPERFLVPVPTGADPKLAVALVLDGVTAYAMLHHAAQVKSAQKLFVHGLSGAVGGALLALAKLHGAEVFGTASPRKHDALRQLGAIPFDYSSKNWIAAMKERGGVDAVFDPLGFKSFDESYSILRKGGILVGYGMNLPGLSGSHPTSVWPVILKLLARNLLFWSGKRTTFFGLTRSSKHYIPDLSRLFEWLVAGTISVPIKGTFKLRDIKDAHREYATSAGLGSIIIEVSQQS
jgi:NADPH:quinone reductase-like Zn-dependent oxidoreductase